MENAEIRKQWEAAAPGWAKWEETVANWIAPATEAMLEMAGVISGAHVLDLASGAGSQTLSAARRVGAQGHIVASDCSEAARSEAWAEVAETLKSFETSTGFEALAEVLVASGAKPK